MTIPSRPPIIAQSNFTSTSVTPTTESGRTSTSSYSSVTYTSAPAAIHASSDHRLANGTVAGIVIGVALGLALVTFLATFMYIRRRSDSATKGKRGALDTGVVGQRYQDSESKGPSVTETPSGSASIDSFLPQSADDKTIHTNVKTTLDQIELHVENFYQNAASSSTKFADAELAIFNSPYLPKSLAALLPQTNNQVPLIKHALAYFATSCISTTASPDWSLLPKAFVLLPSAIRAASSTSSTKPGKSFYIAQTYIPIASLIFHRVQPVHVSMASTYGLPTTEPFGRYLLHCSTQSSHQRDGASVLEGFCTVAKIQVQG